MKRLSESPNRISGDWEHTLVTRSNGLEISVPVDLTQGLAGASATDLETIEISPTGLGLHWPALDADLYLPGLLQGIFGSRRWMAREMGQAGGQDTSSAKQAAARTNAQRGGRPRKSTHA